GPFTMDIEIIDCSCQTPVTVSAGSDQTICSDQNTITLSGTSTNAPTVLWTTSGSGAIADATTESTTYTITAADIAAGTLTFTLTGSDPDGSGPCTGATDEMTVTLNPVLTPTFDPIGPLCLNSAAPALPGTSTNGVSGSWSPATINTSVTGSTVYTFTPSAGACAVGTSISINITPTTPVPVITGNNILCVGNSTTMTANPGGGTWNSSNTGVATI